MACWGAEAAVKEDEGGEDLMRDSTTWYKSTGSDAVEDEDDDLMREIYEAMEAQCGLRGGGPSPSTRRPTPASRPSWCLADALSRRGVAMADAPSSESRGSEAHDGAPAGSSERWEREVEAHTPDAPPHNGVPPRDERSGAHEGVLHLSQAERWSSQASHMSPASRRTSPHYVAHNREERLGRARQACRSLELDLGLGPDPDLVSHCEEHQHTGEGGAHARRTSTGTDGDGEVRAGAGGSGDVAYAADILMAREEGDAMAREDVTI